MRRHQVTAVCEHGVAAGHGKRRQRRAAERHGQVGGQLFGFEPEPGHVLAGLLDADAAQQPNGNQVAGVDHRFPQAGGTVELFAEVLRLPGALQFGVLEDHRRVVDEAGDRESVLERGRIDERLETRAGLPAALQDAVELAAREIVAADQGLDVTGSGVQGHQRRLDLRQLSQAPGAVVMQAGPDDVARLHDVRDRLGLLAGPVAADKRGGPAHVLERQGDGLAVAQVDDRKRVLDLDDQSGFEPGNRTEWGQRLLPVRGGLPVCQVNLRFGSAESMPVVVFLEPGRNRTVGRRLEPAVDGRDHLVAALVSRHPEPLQRGRADHFRNVGRGNLGNRAMVEGPVGLGDGRVEFGPVDELQFEHSVEYVVAALQRALRRGDRVDPRRRLGQGGDHRALSQRQLVRRLSVVDLGGRADAVSAVAEEDLVHVQLEDLVLVQLPLDAQRQEDFLDLSRECLLRGQEEIARQLLRDRAPPDGFLAGGQQCQGRPSDALVIDSRVFVEPGILAGDERLLQAIGSFFDGHRNAPLLAENSDQTPVRGEHAQRNLQLDVAQCLHVGQIAAVEDPRNAHADDAQQERSKNCDDQPTKQFLHGEFLLSLYPKTDLRIDSLVGADDGARLRVRQPVASREAATSALTR